MLLDCGAPILPADYDRRTAMHLAASEGHKHIVEELLNRPQGKELAQIADRWGGLPLDDARRHGHAHVVAILE